MKNSIFSLTVLLIGLMAIGAFSNSTESERSLELVWEDHFEENKIDTAAWSVIVGNGCPELCGWGNNELQYYDDNLDNIKVEDGVLKITAHKKSLNGSLFTSGKLVTKNKADWKYGRIEVRAMMPKGKGTWPAIWMLPTINDRKRNWPRDGEIDIAEHVGYNQGMIYGTIHTDKYNGMIGTHQPDSIYFENAHLEYHTYGIEWTEESITWFADDAEYHKLSKGRDDVDGWPFDQFDYHLILNLAVGGNWGGKYGVAEDVWPQTFAIDYVKYYEIKDSKE